MGRTDNAKRNLIWGFIQKIVSVLIPFVSRTIMIYVLGMEYIGLNSLFASILSMLSFAELGIGSALVFSMYKPIADGDDDKVCALLAFYRRCYIVIGTIIVGCGLVILPFLDKFITGDVPSDTNIYVLFLIYLFNNAVGYFLFAYKQSILIASQRIDLVSKVNLIVSFFLNVLQIAALLIFRSYYAFIIILPVSTCVSNLWIAYVTKEHYPQYICKGMIGKEEIKVIAEKVGGLLCQKIGNIVLCNVDAIVISSFLGLRILGIYNGYFYVISTLMGFLYIIQQTLIPSVGNSIAKESKEKNYKDFSKFQYIYMWIVSWCSVCLLVLFQPFIGMWQGTENMLGIEIAVLMTWYFFVYKMGDMSYVYKEAIGLWWQGKYIPLISSMVNLVLNISLVQIIGLPGIIISTIISAICVNTPFGSRVLFKHYFNSNKLWLRFLRDVFIWFVKCLVCCGITWICVSPVGNGIIGMAIKAFACIIIPNLLLLAFNFKNAEFKEAFAFGMGIIKRKSKRRKSMSNMNQKCFTVSNIRTEIRGGGGVILPVISMEKE